MFAWLFTLAGKKPVPNKVAEIPAWKLAKTDLKCDVCGLCTPPNPSNSWRPRGAKFKWGFDQLCYVCEGALERWPGWSAESLVEAMPNQRAVWVAFRHTNRLRRASNTRFGVKNRRRHHKYRPIFAEKRIRELLVVTAKRQ